MKIGIVSSYPPMPCGIGEYARSLAKALARRGHEVTVIATEWEGAPREELDDNVKVVRSWVRGSEDFHRDILSSVEELGPFDVVEVQYEYGLWPVIPLDSRGLWLMRRLKELSSAVVVTPHTVRVSSDPIWREMHEELLELADAVVLHHAVQEIALSTMVRPRKIRIIPHGSERLPGERGELPYKRPVVMLYGLLRLDKGLDTTINAFKRIEKGTLILAGKPLSKEDEEAIQGLLNYERANKRVVFMNKYLGYEELGSFIKSVDYVLFPYKDIPTDFGISGAFHTTIGTGGKPLCSRTQRLIECWEVAREATFSVDDHRTLASLISRGLPQDVWGRLWRLGDETSWSSVALLRERLYRSLL